MNSKELTEQGVAALKEGDKTRAHELLEQAVEADPNNAKAWYFLSRTQTSVAEKRTSLNTVLAIMPDNRLAREALEKLDDDDEDFSVFEDVQDEVDEEPVQATSNPNSQPISMSGMPRMGLGTGLKPKIGTIQIPVAIEDAPDFVMPNNIWNEFVARFKNGIEILRRTPSIYPMEMQQATWWRFWQFIIISWVISAVASTISSYIAQAQLAAAINSNPFMADAVASPSIFSSLLSLILFIPITAIVMYVGFVCVVSFCDIEAHGQASFLVHAYTISLPLVTAGLITDVVNLVFSIIPFMAGLAALALFVFWLYSMYIAANGLAIAHKVEVNSGYWTMATMALAQIVTTIVLLIVLSPFILSSRCGFILNRANSLTDDLKRCKVSATYIQISTINMHNLHFSSFYYYYFPNHKDGVGVFCAGI